MRKKFIQKKSQGIVSVHRRIMSVIILLRWILTWFGLRSNDKGLWMWYCILNIHKHKEFLNQLCTCQQLWGLLHSIVIFTISLLQNCMIVSYSLCPVLLFCYLLWPMSTTSMLWLLFCVVVFYRTFGYLKEDVGVWTGSAVVSTGRDVQRVIYGRVCREECFSNAELFLNPNIS